MTLAADIGRATFAGIEARDVSARVTIDGAGLQIDRLAVADYGGGSFAASGRIDTSGRVTAWPAEYRYRHQADGGGRHDRREASLRNLLAPSAVLLIVLDMRSCTPRRILPATTKHPLRNWWSWAISPMRASTCIRAISGDWPKRTVADIRFDGRLSAAEGAPLISLLRLEQFVAAGKGPGQLKLQVSGPVDGDMALGIQVAAAGLSAKANGKARFSAEKGPQAEGNLQVQEADIRPLRPAAVAGSADPLPLTMTSRIAITSGAITLDGIDAKFGGSGIRGRVAVDNASPRRINGTIEADAAEVPAFIAWAVGLPAQATRAGAAWNWSGEPFGAGLFGKLSGQVALKLKQVKLLPQLTASDINATLRFGKDDILFADAAGHLAGGPLSGRDFVPPRRRRLDCERAGFP